MIHELETLSKLPPQVRKDVDHYCQWRGCSYSLILKADELDVWARMKRAGLINYLAARGHRLKKITQAAGVSKDFAINEIKKHREPDFPIKTTNWEDIACR